MAFLDSLLGLAIVVAFVYFLFVRVTSKFPKVQEHMDKFSPKNIYEQPDQMTMDKSQQKWIDNRRII